MIQLCEHRSINRCENSYLKHCLWNRLSLHALCSLHCSAAQMHVEGSVICPIGKGWHINNYTLEIKIKIIAVWYLNECHWSNLHMTGSLLSSGLPPYVFTVKSMPIASISTVWEIMEHCNVLCCSGAYLSAWGSVPTSSTWKSKPLTYSTGNVLLWNIPGTSPFSSSSVVCCWGPQMSVYLGWEFPSRTVP